MRGRGLFKIILKTFGNSVKKRKCPTYFKQSLSRDLIHKQYAVHLGVCQAQLPKKIMIGRVRHNTYMNPLVRCDQTAMMRDNKLS
jgi:hypothetical protein